MAVTKTHPVKSTLKAAIDYICNPAKTDGRLLVSSYPTSTFNRPGIQEALSLVEQGLVENFIVKDMSRFGRDYLQVGQYTELVFPSYDVRFIAIHDGVDSAKGDNDFTPFRNLFNDFYAKDTSKKVRSVMRAKGNSGKHLGSPPYGYRNDPEDKHHWLIDEEAAPVIRRIFDLTIDGKGPTKIARILESGCFPCSDRKVCGCPRTDTDDCKRVHQEDSRLRTGQVQWKASAACPHLL